MLRIIATKANCTNRNDSMNLIERGEVDESRRETEMERFRARGNYGAKLKPRGWTCKLTLLRVREKREKKIHLTYMMNNEPFRMAENVRNEYTTHTHTQSQTHTYFFACIRHLFASVPIESFVILSRMCVCVSERKKP